MLLTSIVGTKKIVVVRKMDSTEPACGLEHFWDATKEMSTYTKETGYSP